MGGSLTGGVPDRLPCRERRTFDVGRHFTLPHFPESVFSWPVITSEMTEGPDPGAAQDQAGPAKRPVMARQLALFDMGGDARWPESDRSCKHSGPGPHGATGGR